jgi:hypothetical protein
MTLLQPERAIVIAKLLLRVSMSETDPVHRLLIAVCAVAACEPPWATSLGKVSSFGSRRQS